MHQANTIDHVCVRDHIFVWAATEKAKITSSSDESKFPEFHPNPAREFLTTITVRFGSISYYTDRGNSHNTA